MLLLLNRSDFAFIDAYNSSFIIEESKRTSTNTAVTYDDAFSAPLVGYFFTYEVKSFYTRLYDFNAFLFCRHFYHPFLFLRFVVICKALHFYMKIIHVLIKKNLPNFDAVVISQGSNLANPDIGNIALPCTVCLWRNP